jgi:hypothetical protein
MSGQASVAGTAAIPGTTPSTAWNGMPQLSRPGRGPCQVLGAASRYLRAAAGTSPRAGQPAALNTAPAASMVACIWPARVSGQHSDTPQLLP